MKLTIKILITLVVSSTFLSAPVFAQVLEEVIVTAQKREQSIQDVGISITALSGDTINALGLDNMMEIPSRFRDCRCSLTRLLSRPGICVEYRKTILPITLKHRLLYTLMISITRA